MAKIEDNLPLFDLSFIGHPCVSGFEAICAQIYFPDSIVVIRLIFNGLHP